LNCDQSPQFPAGVVAENPLIVVDNWYGVTPPLQLVQHGPVGPQLGLVVLLAVAVDAVGDDDGGLPAPEKTGFWKVSEPVQSNGP
jgi:hypothetical protein